MPFFKSVTIKFVLFLCCVLIPLEMFASECTMKTDYATGIGCSGYFEAHTQADLDQYLLEYGLNNGNYKHLEIFFDTSVETFEIHSPCIIEIDKGVTFNVTNFCLDGRKGVDDLNGYNVTAQNITLLSEQGDVQFGKNSNVTSDNLKMQGFGELRIGNKSIVNINGDVLLYATGNLSKSEVIVGNNVTFNAHHFEAKSETESVFVGKNTQVTTNSIFMQAWAEVTFKPYSNFTVLNDFILKSIGTTDHSEFVIKTGVQISANNLSMNSPAWALFAGGTIINVANHLDANAPDCDVNGSSQINASSITGTCFGNPNDAPVMGEDQFFEASDIAPITFTLNSATDLDSDSLTYTLVSPPSYGVLANCLMGTDDLSCTYTPDGTYVGAVTFSFIASDGVSSALMEANVTINVIPSNTPPVMIGDQIETTLEDNALNFSLLGATDEDGDDLTYTIVDGPAVGTITDCGDSSGNLNCVYTSPLNFNGQVTFTYIASDGIFDSATFSTVTINVTSVNDAPQMIEDQSFVTNEDSPITFTLSGATDIENDALEYDLVDVPSNGVLSDCLGGTDNLTCTFTPDLNFSGPVTFTYKAYDGNLDSSTTSIVIITVNQMNDLPIMVGDQEFTTDEDAAISFNLLGATDIDGDNLTYAIVDSPSKGVLSGCLGGTENLNCTYAPTQDDNGQVTFSYRAYDGNGYSSTVSTVTINITPQNDIPIIGESQTFDTAEDAALSFTLNTAYDVDGDSLTYSIVDAPATGTISNCLAGTNDLTCDFLPELNFNGQITFTYIVSDGTLNSSQIATVTINVSAINDLPVMAIDQNAVTVEDTQIVINLSGATDLDGDTLVYSIVDAPTSGTLSNCLGSTSNLSCTYIPASNFNGQVTFSYRAFDGIGYSTGVSTVTVDVTAVNDSPVMVEDQTFSTNEDQVLEFTLSGASDVDGDPINYTIVDNPVSGAISDCLNNSGDLICKYTPEVNFNGQVTFTYKASDGTEDSQMFSTVTIDVLPINDAPVMVSDQEFTTNEDTNITFLLTGANDTDGDDLTYEIVTPPATGTLSGCLGGSSLNCSYSPAQNVNGQVTFTYRASDGNGYSSTVSTVTINITPVNDAPIIGESQTFDTTEDTTLSFTLNSGSDIDGDSLTYSIVDGPASGTISNCLAGTNDLTCDFTPELNFNGQIIFTYVVSDGTQNSSQVAIVTIDVAAINDLPVMVGGQNAVTTEDTQIIINLLGAIDLEGDTLFYSIVDAPASGTLTNCLGGTSNLACTYIPASNFSGQVIFSYRAFDGIGFSTSVSTVTVDVTAVNDSPVMVEDQTFSTNEDQVLEFTLSGASDVDGDPINYTIVDNPASGTISDCLNNSGDLVCKYTPEVNFNGQVTFTYKASDGIEDSQMFSTVTIDVLPVNDAPVMGVDQTFTTEEDTSVAITLSSATDLDNDSVTYSIASAPTSGILYDCMEGTNDLTCNYSPVANFNGQVSFTYKANDGTEDSAGVTTITINVTPVNDAPVIGEDQSFDTTEDTTVSFTLNSGSDIDGDFLTYSIVDVPASGTISNCLTGTNDLTCDFLPGVNFNGQITFTYIVSDGTLSSSQIATVTIDVAALNDLPVMVSDQNIVTTEDTQIAISLSGATDLDGDTLLYSIVDAPTSGTLSNCLAGTSNLACTYIPASNYNGQVTFSYRAFDGIGYSASVSTVTVDVTAVNDSPVMVEDQTFSTNEDQVLEFTLSGASDVDGDPINYTIVDNPVSGTISDCLNNSGDLICKYTPEVNFNGQVTFTYKASDGIEDSQIFSTVTIDVMSVNDAPVMGVDQTFTTEEDTSVAITLSGATDLDNDSVTYSIASAPTSGILYDCMEGTNDLTCNYSPAANFNGQVSFTYKANDGTEDSAGVTTITINVTPVNDAPVMGSNQTFTTIEDTPIVMEMNLATDVDNDPLTYVGVIGSTEGSVSNCSVTATNLICTYTPYENNIGTDTFAYIANDGMVYAPTYTTITINITAVNDVPIMIGDQAVTTVEDTSVLITLSGATDPDDDSNIKYTIVDVPTSGTLSDCLGGTQNLTCTYIPTSNFNGQVSFTYKASDWGGDSDTVSTVTIDITPVNDAPIIGDSQTFNTTEDTTLSFTLNTATDIDGDSLAYSIVEGPASGTISNCLTGTNDLTCDFTPELNFNGQITFTYIVSDGTLNSSQIATVTINVAAVNDLPLMAIDQNVITNEDTQIVINLSGATDLDGDTLVYSIVDAPSSGILSNCLGGTSNLACIYIPASNFNGQVTFSYRAFDGIGYSTGVSTITVDVTPVNDTPVIGEDQAFDTIEDTALSFTLSTASDIDGDSLAYSIVDGPATGTISNCLAGTDDLTCDFLPASNSNETITFTYKVSDGTVDSNSVATVSINVTPVNDPPVMVGNESFTTNEDVQISFILSGATDLDGDTLIYSIVDAPTSGTLSNCLGGTTDLSCTFIPSSNFSGQVTFSYRVSDGIVNSATVSTVTIDVTPVSDAPVMIGDSEFVTEEDEVFIFTLSGATDIDSIDLTYSITELPVLDFDWGEITDCMEGTLDLECTFTPAPNFSGEITFRYTANDGERNAVLDSLVTLTINPKNDLPNIVGEQILSTNKNTSLDFMLYGVEDIDGDLINYQIVTAPVNGTLSNCLGNTGDISCTYIPNLDFVGVDTFTYIANDGTGDSEIITVIINVLFTNELPVPSEGQIVNAIEDTPVSFEVVPAVDSDGDLLSYTILSTPNSGNISNCMLGTDDLTCDYMPNENFNGYDSFIYSVSDGTGTSLETGEVRIKVAPVNDVPVMGANQTFTTSEDTSIVLSLNLASDIDNDTLSYTVAASPTMGVISDCSVSSSNLVCTYTPNSNANGTDTFGYVVHDGTTYASSLTMVTIIITSNNDSPVMLANQTVDVTEDTFSTFIINGAIDPDGDALTYELVDAPSSGILSNCVNNSGSLSCSYMPEVNLSNTTVTFTYRANDGQVDSPTYATVTLNILSVNDVPIMATDQNFTTSEDTSIQIVLSAATDVENDLLTYRIDSSPTNGALADCMQNTSDLTCTYTPNSNFNGGDSFTYIANDGSGDALNVTTVNISIVGTNDAPAMIGDQTFETNEDTFITFELSGASDPENASLIYELVDSPMSGILTNCADGSEKLTCSYMPDANYFGQVVFTYRAKDLEGMYSTTFSTITLNISPINDRPIMAIEQNVETNQNATLNLTLTSAVDVDSTNLTYRIVTSPEHGILTECLGGSSDLTCTYTPQANYYGEDSFSYIASDGEIDAEVATIVNIDVKRINNAPQMIEDQSFETDQNVAISFKLSGATDGDGNALTYEIVTPPSSGTLGNCLNNTGDLTCNFIPERDFSGQVSFSYRASDGMAFTDENSLVTIKILETEQKSPIVQISAGWEHACAVNEDGKAKCWGNNTYGQLGYGHTNTIGDDEKPSDVSFIEIGEKVVQISAGRFHTCAVLESGNVKCWGGGLWRHLGYGNTDDIGDDEKPIDVGYVNIGEKVIKIVTGSLNTCALLESENIKCWGSNHHGQLGYGNTVDIGGVDTPADHGYVSLNEKVKDISSNGTFNCALLESGKIQCWGINGYGYLGYGHINNIGDDELPSSVGYVDIGSDVKYISSGMTHSCVVAVGGQLKCWGVGNHGQLGYGSAIKNLGDDEVPSSYGYVDVGELVDEVSTQGMNTCALLKTKEVKCWGDHQYGQLGFGYKLYLENNEKWDVPSNPVSIGGSVVQISTGGNFICALLITGDVKCWGKNNLGQLGYGHTNNIGNNETPADIEPVDVGIDGGKLIFASFVYEPVNGSVPLTVSFDASSSVSSGETIASYSWDFGDTSSGSGVATSHTYLTTGTFAAKLTVTDDQGNSDTREVQIKVNPISALPVAGFLHSPEISNPPSLIVFDGTPSSDSDGTVVKYEWNFGDGNFGTGTPISHSYQDGGTYTVKLTVTDNTGGVSFTEKIVIINKRPSAIIATNVVFGDVPLTVGFSGVNSFDTDGTIADYSWDFGNGNSGNGLTISHVYMEIGSYIARLTVTDNDGVSSYSEVEINVTPVNVYPIAGISSSHDMRSINEVFSFNGSSSSDSDGTIVDYSWDFGDGNTGTGEIIDHSYIASGTYIVELTVTDNRGGADVIEKQIVVNQAPVANIASNVVSGDVPLQVLFDASGSSDVDGTISTYSWNFGDGGSGLGQSINHTYNDLGTYTATLLVTDNYGVTNETQIQIEVLPPNILPIALFEQTDDIKDMYIPVSFDASGSSDSDGTIAIYSWDFGDGNTGSGVSIDHLYQVAGNYTTTLTVTDNKGDTSSYQRDILVTSPIILINSDEMAMAVGDQKIIESKFFGVKGDSYDTSYVTWQSSNESVLTIDSTGKATALTFGETFITAHLGSLQSKQVKISVKEFQNDVGFILSDNYIAKSEKSIINGLITYSSDSHMVTSNYSNDKNIVEQNGKFELPIYLNPGNNSLTLNILDSSGGSTSTVTKDVYFFDGRDNGFAFSEANSVAQIKLKDEFPPGSFSISILVKNEDVKFTGALLNLKTDVEELGLKFNFDSNGIPSFSIPTDNMINTVFGYEVTEDETTQVGLVYDHVSKTIKFYQDRRSISERVLAGNIIRPSILINGQLGGDSFKGVIDELRIWNKALTDTEMFNEMLAPVSSESIDLYASFSFDDVDGQTIREDNGRNATIVLGLNESFEDVDPSFRAAPKHLVNQVIDNSQDNIVSGGDVSLEVKKGTFTSDIAIDLMLLDEKSKNLIPDELNAISPVVSILGRGDNVSMQKEIIVELPFYIDRVNEINKEDIIAFVDENNSGRIKILRPQKIDFIKGIATFELRSLGNIWVGYKDEFYPEIFYVQPTFSDYYKQYGYYDRWIYTKIERTGVGPFTVDFNVDFGGTFLGHVRINNNLISKNTDQAFTLDNLVEGKNSGYLIYYKYLSGDRYLSIAHLFEIDIEVIAKKVMK